MNQQSVSPKRSRASRAMLALLVAALGVTMVPGVADAAKGKKGKKKGQTVSVMTRNVYLGSSLSAGLNAGNPNELCDGAGQVLRDVDASRPAERMAAIANEIKKAKPDIVGLQEAAAYYTQSPPDNGALLGGTDATTVKYDFLQMILDNLNKGKKRYVLVKSTNEFEFEFYANYDGVGSGCAGAEIDARMLMRDAILAKKGAVKASKVTGANFDNQLVLPISGFPLNIKRGWEAADFKVRGAKPFRLVNTHLEAFDSQASGNLMCSGNCTAPVSGTTEVTRGSIRKAQALEVVNGPAKSKLPTLLIGDLNSNVPGVQEGDSQAFQAVLDAGFVRRSTQTPASCCADDLITGTGADFDHVVDHIVGKPGKKIKLVKSQVVGLAKVGGIYPSDHAGVISKLRMPSKAKKKGHKKGKKKK